MEKSISREGIQLANKKLNIRVASDSKETIEMLKNDFGIFPEIRRRCDEIAELLTEAGIMSLMVMFDELEEDEFIDKIKSGDVNAKVIMNEDQEKKLH